MKKLLYIEIAEKIMFMALSGEIKPGDKISSVREMAIEQQVNPKTIQKAFNFLDEIGIFRSVVGGGRYLSDDINILEDIKTQLIKVEVKDFIYKLKEYGYSKEEIIKYIEEEYE